jgi:hypothetical protein
MLHANMQQRQAQFFYQILYKREIKCWKRR